VGEGIGQLFDYGMRERSGVSLVPLPVLFQYASRNTQTLPSKFPMLGREARSS